MQTPQANQPAATETPAQPAADSRARVALLVPLSGPNASLGRAILEAAQMAVFDASDDRFELMPRDTKGTAEGAARAASAALDEGAQLILGPLLAAEVEAVKPVASAARINVVAFSTAVRLAGDGTYLMGFLPKQEVTRVTSFAKQSGVSRFAALAPNNAYGQLVVDELRAAAATLGATVDRVELYDPNAGDLTPVVQRFAGGGTAAGGATASAPPFNALMLPEGGAKLKAIAALLPANEVDPTRVRLLGTGLWDEPGLGAEPALVGGWFAAPPTSARADFERRFQDIYKHKPPRLATLGYDATALAAALARHPGGPDFSATALGSPSGFAGVDGIFRLLPNGLVQRGLAVLEVRPEGVVVVSPAPETFEDLAF